MNVREPDWSYVGRSLVKVLAVSAALFMALNMAEGFLRTQVDLGQWRAAEVRATADRIANPEKRLRAWPDSSRLTDAISSVEWASRIDAKPTEYDQEVTEEARKTREEARKTIDKLPGRSMPSLSWNSRVR
ncbi:hypothetical protein ACLQ2R_16740 [Streptosporangium sp. DT93]|uniref:hypothetical protein n=1 Tax=Streptosporangium sp. DT93 TaxID=3393428 RepID=UPI003CF81C2D